jgi:EmrB/QacA subfamily drug resistance transporter
MTAVTTEAPGPVRVFGRSVEYKWVVASVLVSALFLDVLDVTIVNVALPQLGEQLRSDAVEWVVLGYTLALAVSIPVAGWWSDRIGTKRAFLVSMALFIGSSLLCGMAQTMGQLIAFRVIQGIGGGMLTPIGISMMFRAFPPHERARASTFVMIPTLMAPALGPVLGGLIVTHIGWRWIFWVNLPIGLAAFAFGWAFLREHKEPTAGRFDLPGFVLSAAGLSLGVYALSEGPRAGWSSPVVLVTGVVGVAALVAFVIVELRVSEPMLDLRLLQNRMFRNANIVMGLSMAAFLGLLFVLPLYLQNLRGLSALESGLATFPQALGVMISTVVAGRLYATVGPRRLVAVGLWGAAIVMLWFQWFDEDSSLWWVRGMMFLRGLTAGLSFMPIQASAYSTISPADTGRASSIFSTQRQIAISVGVATLATVLVAFTPLVGTPSDVQRALDGYHAAALVATGFALAAGCAAFFLIKDEDAAATMRRQ